MTETIRILRNTGTGTETETETENREHPVKERLREIGHDQSWLAQQSGCSTSTISSYLAGRHEMKRSTYRCMMAALGIGENYLYNAGPRRGNGRA